ARNRGAPALSAAPGSPVPACVDSTYRSDISEPVSRQRPRRSRGQPEDSQATGYPSGRERAQRAYQCDRGLFAAERRGAHPLAAEGGLPVSFGPQSLLRGEESGGQIDYQLARRHLLNEYKRGRLSKR